MRERVTQLPTRRSRRLGSRTSGSWGILGGTFDPIHYGHLAMAEGAREELGLTRVLFVPAGVPPHKTHRAITPPGDRMAMIELAIEGNDAFELSSIEVDRPGPSYAVDTLEELATARARGASGRAPEELVFILSAEALAMFREWRRPERILELTRLAVVPRPGHRSPGRSWVSEHFPGREDRVEFLELPELGHSSSAIRRRASEGRSIRYLVPPAVEAYITQRQLYRSDPWTKN